jgi:hypothetical protein
MAKSKILGGLSKLYNSFLTALQGAKYAKYNQNYAQPTGQTAVAPTQYQSKYADYSGLVTDAQAARDSAISYAEATKNNAVQYATDTKTNAYGSAQQAKDVSYADAERMREKAIQDANLAYMRSQPTYGANAEALLSSGLTGSGYSDYLAGKAYATNRADIAAARNTEAESRRVADIRYADALSQADQNYANSVAQANKNFADAQASAEGKYLDYINGIKGNVISENAKFEEEAKSAYSTVLGLAASGASQATIDAYVAKYGDYYGWTADEKKVLTDVVNEYKAAYTLTDGSGNNVVVNNGSQQPQTVQQAQQQNKKTVLDAINAGDASVLGNLASYVENGQIAESDLPEIYKASFVSIINSADSTSQIDNYLSMIDDHNLSDADKEEIRSLAHNKKIELEKKGTTMLMGVPVNGVSTTELQDKANEILSQRTGNTSPSGTAYHWDRHIFALGGKPTITYADGTTDQVTLKLYATPKAAKALGKGKEGEIKKYGDDYYVYDGSTSWIMLKGMDYGQKYFTAR